MKQKSTPESLQLQTTDYVASAAKAILGEVPFVGSLLIELAGTVIPNQRMERIARYAESLDQRLAELEEHYVRSRLTNENFTDLMEEGLRQAARAVSDERREYIASLVANSLSSDRIEYEESKHLLRLLEEINDIEVIWLRSYLFQGRGEDQEFRTRHEEILAPAYSTKESSQEERDKATLQDSYKAHLAQLGLLGAEDKSVTEDRISSELTFERYTISALGRLLLREIGLSDKSN